MTEDNDTLDGWEPLKIDLNYKPEILVTIENGEIGLRDTRLAGNQYYWIDLDRIKTQRDLLEWVHHLSGKAWVTNRHIRQFIARVFKYREWTLYKGV
jgi:hypothetical protein